MLVLVWGWVCNVKLVMVFLEVCCRADDFVVWATRVVLHLIRDTILALSKELHSFVTQPLWSSNHCIWDPQIAWTNTSTRHLKWTIELGSICTMVIGGSEVLQSHGLKICIVVSSVCKILIVNGAFIRWGRSRAEAHLTNLNLRLAQFEMIWLDTTCVICYFELIQILRAELNLVFKTYQVFKHWSLTTHGDWVKLELWLTPSLFGCEVLEKCGIFKQFCKSMSRCFSFFRCLINWANQASDLLKATQTALADGPASILWTVCQFR